VIDLTTNEVIQVKECENPTFYDFDVDKACLQPVSKNLTFYKEKRFNNKGIFGNLYDPNKDGKFGTGGESAVDKDKVQTGLYELVKPRIQEPKQF
jgi:hypothetical protein